MMRNCSALLLIAIIFSCSISELKAQGNVVPYVDGGSRFASYFGSLRQKKTIDLQDFPTVGTLYINKEFSPCKIYYKEQLVGEFLYRYNGYHNEVEIRSTDPKDTNTSSLIITKDIWVYDLKSKQKMGVMTVQNGKGSLSNAYLYALSSEGNYRLCVANRIKFTEGKPPGNSFMQATPNRFSLFQQYYLFNSNESIAYPLSKSKSSVLDLLSDEKKSKAKSFIKKNKISMKDEADLVALANYLNSL